MELITVDHWNEARWLQAEPIYNRSFPAHGRKNRSIVRSMLERRLGFLHLGVVNAQPTAMALSGKLDGANALLIDYLAVREDCRWQGIGRRFLELIGAWAADERHLDGILIEIEADATQTNLERLRFWESCGFASTDYVHQYIWVPEPYRAMVLDWSPDGALPKDGESLFRHIIRFHRKAYSGQK